MVRITVFHTMDDKGNNLIDSLHIVKAGPFVSKGPALTKHSFCVCLFFQIICVA